MNTFEATARHYLKTMGPVWLATALSLMAVPLLRL